MDVGRFNLSHGTHADHTIRFQALRQAAQASGRHVGAMWDTKGPEVRLGTFSEKTVTLKTGETFVLMEAPTQGTASSASTTLADLTRYVKPGMTILLDDGNVTLTVLGTEPGRVVTRIQAGGELSSRKKVTLVGSDLDLPAISAEDLNDLTLGAELGADILAASFVRTPAHILEIRQVVQEMGWTPLLIAKIETREAVNNLDGILRVADGIMVARGDLGVEFLPEEVPIIQKKLISSANRVGKPVVTATQMLESMVSRSRPTRAEASDVANAIFDGTDAVMLSAETASGQWPVEAVSVMARIAQRADAALIEGKKSAGALPSGSTVTEAISTAIWEIARDIGAAAIVCATQSGHTARMVSRHRPEAALVAATPDPQTARKLAVVWGAYPVLVPAASSTDGIVSSALEAAERAGFLKQGDVAVVTAGVPVGVPGTTNLIQVHTIGEAILKGQGLGFGSVSGRAVVIRHPKDGDRVGEGDILIALSTDARLAGAVERAGALVVEEGGLTSHAAVSGVSLGKPVIVGATGALETVHDHDWVTVDARKGLVYRRAEIRRS